MSEQRADGGERNPFGVEASGITVSQAVGGGEWGAGAVAEIEELSLDCARGERKQLRGSRSGLMIHRSCDGLLEAVGNGDRAPPADLRRPDPEAGGSQVGLVVGQRLPKPAPAVCH